MGGTIGILSSAVLRLSVDEEWKRILHTSLTENITKEATTPILTHA